MRRRQIALVGVGGQGVLAAAQILGAALHATAVPVVVGQLHGMSQRGGSVSCTIIVGEAESSFMCGREADLIIALEPLEALRATPLMGRATCVVMCRTLLVPFEAVLTNATPPDVDELIDQIRGVAGEVHALDTRRLIGSVGETRALNVLMLGAASGLGVLQIPEPALLDAIARRCGERYLDANRRAFFLGRDALRGTVRCDTTKDPGVVA